MKNVLLIGIAVAAAVYAITIALHLLNRPSDLAVTGGYLILLAILAGGVELARRRRR